MPFKIAAIGILSAVFLAAAWTSAQAQGAPFSVGETIHFNITKLGFKVGTASLVYQGPVTIKGKNAILIIFTSQGVNFYDKEHIYLDPETFRPLLVARDINIFGQKEKIGEEYTPEGVKITKRVGSKVSNDLLPVNGPVDNIYGFIYRYRAQGSFAEGDTIDVRLPTKFIRLKLKRQEPVNIAKKRYDSYYMESEPAQYKVWFDASPAKLPLRISGAVGLANTLMVMQSYEPGGQ